MAKFPFWDMDYSPWSSKNLIVKRSNDDFESLLPQGGGAVGGASGWSKEGKDEDDKATKPEKREGKGERGGK